VKTWTPAGDARQKGSGTNKIVKEGVRTRGKRGGECEKSRICGVKKLGCQFNGSHQWDTKGKDRDAARRCGECVIKSASIGEIR